MIHALAAAALSVLLNLGGAAPVGVLHGVVTDQDGNGLSGVTVEVFGPIHSETITDLHGYYDFHLPAGVYNERFTLEGFIGIVQKNVVVRDYEQTVVNGILKAARVNEVLTVTSVAPLIDIASPRLTPPTAPSHLRWLGTDIHTLLGWLGEMTTADVGGLAALGSRLTSRDVLIDGVNVESPEERPASSVSPGITALIDMATTGRYAHQGGSRSTLIQLTTASGGNEFAGSVEGRLQPRRGTADTSTLSPATSATRQQSDRELQATLGGPILRDQLFFFTSYRDSRPRYAFQDLGSADMSMTVDAFQRQEFAKFSGNAQTINAELTFMRHLHRREGALGEAPGSPPGSLNGTQSALSKRSSITSDDLIGAITNPVSSTFVADLRGGYHRETYAVEPLLEAGSGVEYRDVGALLMQSGGSGWRKRHSFDRVTAKGTAGAFLSHEGVTTRFDAGLEFENSHFHVNDALTGDELIDVLAVAGAVAYRHYFFVHDGDVTHVPFDVVSKSRLESAFVEAKIDFTDVAASVGLRLDRQNSAGPVALRTSLISPRVAIRSTSIPHMKVFATAGRYVDPLTALRLTDIEMGMIRGASLINNTSTPIGGRGVELVGGTVPGTYYLRPRYSDEYTVGAEGQLPGRIVLGIQAIRRDLRSDIETYVCSDDGLRCIGNPGRGDMRLLRTLTGELQPSPEAHRRSRAIQMNVSRHFAGAGEFGVTYVLSRTTGNDDDVPYPTGQFITAPYGNPRFDYYDFAAPTGTPTGNADGPLTSDRRHNVKVQGRISIRRYSLSLAAYAMSGTPLTRYGYSDKYGGYPFLLGPRGAEGRTPWIYDGNLRIDYEVRVSELRVTFWAGVYNVINAQRPLLIDQRWDFAEAQNAAPKPANPSYLSILSRTPARSLVIGVHIPF
jgi:Carboxypeptidase regulatory-like domain